MNTDIHFKGSVRSFDKEYAIAGVTVKAFITGDFKSAFRQKVNSPIEIGKAISGADGRFDLIPSEDPVIQEYLCFLNCSNQWSIQLAYVDADDKSLGESKTFSITDENVIEFILPETTKAPSRDQWKKLGKLMKEHKTIRLDHITTELAGLSPSGIFHDWTVKQRLSVLYYLENTFLDPDKILAGDNKIVRMSQLQDPTTRDALREEIALQDSNKILQAFDEAVMRSNLAGGHLNAAGIFLNPISIEKGDISKGVNEFVGRKIVGSLGMDTRPDFNDIFPWFKNPLEQYRDYLVDIWVQRAINQVSGQPLNAAGAIQQLNNRFHQNFQIHDSKTVPANSILINIVKQILLAPTGSGFGFAIPIASIEDQKARSNREYLDYLIGLSGLSFYEMQNRYRINLALSDLNNSNPIQQNIDTIQRFFTDSFQSVTDISSIIPVLTANGLPIINDFTYSKAKHGPFFWEYEEWLEREEPFYGENYFDIRKLFFCYISAEEKKSLLTRTKPLDQITNSRRDDHSYDPPVTITGTNYSQALKAGDQWARNMLDLQDRFADANKDFFGGFFTQAEEKYKNLISVVSDLKVRLSRWTRTVFDLYDPQATANAQRSFVISDPDSLTKFEEANYTSFEGWIDWGSSGAGFAKSWIESKDEIERQPYLIDLLLNRVLPTCLAETRLAVGNYCGAVQGGLAAITEFDVFTGPTPFEPGAKITPTETIWWPSEKATGSLPFATNNAVADQEALRSSQIYFPANETERTYFRLKLGDALLEWADTLYRTDQPENKQRARELYKGVLYLHWEDPGISPLWDESGFLLTISLFAPSRNPLLTVQVTRARNGFDQLNAGLNYYGFPANYVPPIRYRVLKEASEHLANSAKSIQNDYINYMQKYEQAIIDEMTATLMVEKASYSIKIAAEQVEIANFNVGEAQKQVDNVKAQIAAKQKEIADADGFFEQAKTFFGGMKDAAEGLGKSFLGEMEAGGEAAAGSGSMDWGAMYKVISSKGSTSAATAGLTGGMAIMAGYGAFAYAGYTSMQSMADAAAKRSGDLKSLQEVALPMAQKVVELKKRDVTIAKLNKQIAEADYQFGRKMLAFYDYRFLSKAFWQQLASFSNRLLRRYLDLGGRTAWFAERALSFEADKEIRIVSFDYFPTSLRGVTGADQLQLHLAEMESARIQNLSQTIPVKQTFSLSKDFPIAWGQLKKNGTCDFSTSEQLLKLVYPGVYGYRIRCVSIGITYVDETMPHKGMFLNDGYSVVSQKDNSSHRLLRYPDALPLSEFNMRNDMFVYELPDETLLPFEGSGIETTWHLNLSRLGSATSLEGLTDVIFTFDMRARYSAVLKSQQDALLPSTWNKAVLISGKSISATAIAKFKKDGGKLTLKFEPALAAANAIEKSRTVNLLGIVLSGAGNDPVMASLRAETDKIAANFEFENGIALSNTSVMAAANAGVPLSLNPLTGINANQAFIFEMDKSDNAGIDFSKMVDVQLYIEYEAKI
ncbi:MAG: hypothetical protein IT249_08630 [Chitinophagaceae bacterium]|nr:hypothetical protein [Chitinophagaceae bacterium]